MRNNPDDLANQCIEKIINWLNSNIDEENYKDYPKAQEMLAQDSADLKEKKREVADFFGGEVNDKV